MNTPNEKLLIEHQSPYHYTDAGRELQEKAEAALLPLFAEYQERGYSPYDITSVLYESVAEISRGLVTTHRAKGEEAASQQLKDRLKS
jgi:hypothetical protein